MARYRIGEKVRLPDGGYGPVARTEPGVEHGDPVLYVTIINGLGDEQTRWVEQSRVSA